MYLSRHPAPPLSHFVDSLWSLSDAPPHRSERILPSGTLELVINLHEDEFRIYDPVQIDRCRRFSGAIVSGAYGASFIIDTREHASIIGVHFRPGGALPFLGAPPGALADTHVELEALWGRRAIELRERLCAATTPALRFRILEDALLAELRRRPFRHHDAIPAALDYLRQVRASVGNLALRVQLSHRRLIEVFAAEVGMTPKLFARVGRFQRAVALARRAAALRLVQALVGAGSRGPTGGLHLDDLQALRRRKAPARKGLASPRCAGAEDESSRSNLLGSFGPRLGRLSLDRAYGRADHVQNELGLGEHGTWLESTSIV
jgi:AraC-like DNA-binding protein